MSDHGVYFYGTVAFFAGFSERRAKVMLGGAFGGSGPDGSDDDRKKKAATTAAT